MQQFLLNMAALAFIGIVWESTGHFHRLDPLLDPIFERFEEMAKRASEL